MMSSAIILDRSLTVNLSFSGLGYKARKQRAPRALGFAASLRDSVMQSDLHNVEV